jgi:dienelactone hydrolase
MKSGTSCHAIPLRYVAGTVLGVFCPLFGQSSGPPATPPAPLPVGQVIESVVCRHDPTQSYALYLPSTYTAERRWPILYAFDPRARGPVPTKLFRAAAERLGYVVVGSNNSRNGPWEPVVAALNAVWRDTHERLALDPNRIYATGMSGGNGPATLLAVKHGAGIIACAGALTAEQVASVDGRLAWISVAGRTDFSFDVNQKLVETLVARGVNARLTVFAGGHSWPPEDVAAGALEFLQLSAMRTGRLPRDAAFIEHYTEQGLARAHELAARGLADDAAEEYAALSRELKSLASVEAFATEAKRLHDTPEARQNRKREQALAAKYERETQELFELRQLLERSGPFAKMRIPELAEPSDDENVGPGDETTVGSELDLRLDQLVRDGKSQDADVRIVAQRVREGFYMETYYAALDRRDQGRSDSALALLELCARMNPNNAGTAYELARTHAVRGDKQKALAELQKAKALGFADLARLAIEPEWATVRAEPKFREIVDAVHTP